MYVSLLVLWCRTCVSGAADDVRVHLFLVSVASCKPRSVHVPIGKLLFKKSISKAFICSVRNIALYLQNNYKSVTVTELLNSFEPITLDEMSSIRLMNRTDVKFVTTKKMLARLLVMAQDNYLIQEIDGRRMASYYTVYFDTEECDMFMVHHNGRLNRQKLRIRSYVDSSLNFLEVKTKNNHGRTSKQRVAIDNFSPAEPQYDVIFDDNRNGRPASCSEFVTSHLKYDINTLKEQIENRFDRITLVNRQKTERLTIDLNLRFHNLVTNQDAAFDDIVIIELKRDGLAFSPVLEMLRQLRIMPMGFSKYCMGMVKTNSGLKNNRFLQRLRMMEKLRQN